MRALRRREAVQRSSMTPLPCPTPTSHAASYDKATFVAELVGAIEACGVSRGGTALCSAARQTVMDIAAKVDSLAADATSRAPGATAAAGDSASAGASSGSPSAPTQAHSLVLLTDGEATDREVLPAARAMLAQPPLPGGGFRALMVSRCARACVCAFMRGRGSRAFLEALL
jgi:hypothetical protein